ncbi:unnamed protein product [Dibothriocephalus latus]|uniref:Uncharacterized protein n=1 Tax=Dibothriocephalus latus TaxID=60516 RepID=A0A3P7LIK5_DIBLA|nr:unnamed protein product [Dibothriocephalus latus]
MCSLVVPSPFMNVPVQETVHYISAFTLSIQQNLFGNYYYHVHFSVDNNLYRQFDGMIMSTFIVLFLSSIFTGCLES